MKSVLVEYFQKFPDIGVEIPDFESMANCIAPIALFQYFHGDPLNLDAIKSSTEPNKWFDRLKEIRSMNSVLEPLLKKSPYGDEKIDLTALVRRGDQAQLEKLLVHIAFYSFISPKKAEAIDAVKKLEKNSQSIIKKILKPDPPAPSSATTTPTKVESQATPKQTPSTPDPSLNEHISELKAKIDALTNSNNQLKSENESLRNEINTLKEHPPNSKPENDDSEDIAKTMQKIAAIKAEMFVLEQSKKQKTQRKQFLLDIKSHIPTLQENIEKAKNEVKELQSKIDQDENKGPDYTVLYNRLQELRIDPKTKDVSDLTDEVKQLKKQLKEMNKKKDLLQAKLDGQQGIAVLEDRKRFLQQLEITNQQRKQRAQLYLTLSQKKMRSDAFIQEMRSFI